ncbi:hypothetical protein BDD12DRAFT_154160 [Trichophaea hybrida]|nr:hypothetical protein BDD12DRAFT_154160 [Trichophaea hybrida]
MRYSIAQPLTILFWYISSLILVTLTIAAHKYLRLPARNHAFSQSFYYGIISAITYFIISTLLLWNFIGAYVFKKYPPSFTLLTIPQRTLMLQTISYSVYLSLGAGIFSFIEGWSFVDGVYFADYTLLTIGLGSDFPLKRDLSKGLLIPYTAIGIMMIGLVVDSVRILLLEHGRVRRRAIEKERKKLLKKLNLSETCWKREFELMRKVQDEADKRRRWWGLGSSFIAFLIVWLGGATVFMLSESPQGWSFFESLYFTYTSLLTIGYGDFYPESNFGKPFFVIWSLIAIPTVTILISTMGNTVVEWVKKGTLWLGQKTILPERKLFQRPKAVQREVEEAEGYEEDEDNDEPEIREDAERLDRVFEAQEETNHPHHHHLKLIAREISGLAKDIGRKPPKKYEWDSWVRFLELLGKKEDEEDEWMWLGHEGLLISGTSETEWVLGRLCERLEEVLGKRWEKEKEG